MKDKRKGFARWLWLDFRLYIANNVIAYIPIHAIRSTFYRRVMKVRLGGGTRIFMRAWLDCPGGLSIGSNSVINQKCRLDSRGGLNIGDNVSISAEVCILTASHDMQAKDCGGFVRAVTIEDYVFIGTRATILPGVSIGRGAVVGAGAVVSRDVEAYTIVAGVPSKVIGQRTRDLNYSSSYLRFFQ